MIAPISVKETMVRRCPRWKGVSRTIKTRRRRSLSTTSAARVKRVEVTPAPISDIVRTEQGATIMPRVWNDPDAMEAPTSPILWTLEALAQTSATVRPVSSVRVKTDERDMTRWLSTPRSWQASSMRTP